ncbi:hypothetical protein VPH184E373B_0216 [Vibrio phage 184E37-3b]|nr:hypothetical protein MYOV056v2_p0192 [Vibrio phage 184E37.3a]QZI90112.1 hypothetical protein MYOV057v1_p0197 [Vibrio phage 184E37.1]
MCYCSLNLRTPCCGGVSCHPFPSDEEYDSFIEESRNHIIETAHQNPNNIYDILIENSQLQLWQSYTDKKQECEMLRDIINKIPQLIQDSTQEVESHDCWGNGYVEDVVNGEVLAKKLEELLKEV